MNSSEKVEFTYDELLYQNKTLSEELEQCQKDKDFVWNLWKSLQTEKPDMTNIISEVVEREQKKSDAKDLKVLTILQQKDGQIKILQDLSADIQAQLNQTNERLSELLMEQADWHETKVQYDEELNQLRTNIDLEQEVFSSREREIEDMEKNLNKIIERLTNENTELDKKNKLTTEDLASIKKEFSEERDVSSKLRSELCQKEEQVLTLIKNLDEECKQKHDLFMTKQDLEKACVRLKDEISNAEAKYKNNSKVLESRNEKIQDLQKINKDQSSKLLKADGLIHTLRLKLEEHSEFNKHCSAQNVLIKNLETLQDETQNVLSQQGASHQHEIESLRNTISSLTQNNNRLKVSMDKLLVENKQLKELPCAQCIQLEKEYTELKLKYQNILHQNRSMDQSKTSISYDLDSSFSQLSAISNEKSKSNIKLSIQNESLEKMQSVLRAMEEELKTVRTAHKRRLQRYTLLKENYNLVMEQLKTYEKSTILSPEREEPVIPRASSKSLQRENSKSVWNELEYYRREYEKLSTDQPTLNEEVDQLLVKTSRDQTKINQLNLKLLELKNVLRDKEEIYEEELRFTKQQFEDEFKILQSSKINSLKEEIKLYKDKVIQKEKCLIRLSEKNDGLLTHERGYKETINKMALQLKEYSIKTKQCDAATQTFEESYDSKQLYDKLNQVIDVVHSDRLTVSQLESSIQSSLSKTLSTVSTQTMHAMSTSVVDQGVKVKETQTASENKNEDRKQMLNHETQRLLMLKSELFQENRNLKKKIYSTESQISQLRENNTSLSKQVSELHQYNEKIKGELETSLQDVQLAHDALKARTSELVECQNELQILVAAHQKDNREAKNTLKDYKLLANRLNNMTNDYSKVTVQLKTLNGENDLLTEKMKDYQEKIIKLERLSNQKKNYADDLKSSNISLKEKSEELEKRSESAASRLKMALDREEKNKDYISQIKRKLNECTNEKKKLEESYYNIKLEAENKSRLLQESQHLCHQAESAINEMERTTYQQLKQQQQVYEEKQFKLNEKVAEESNQHNEYNKAVQIFCEMLLTMIHENRSNLIDHKKRIENKQRSSELDSFTQNKAHSIACSILDMSTTDLQDFMREESSEIQLPFPAYEDNDIREKLDLILTKKANFSNVLARFLVDLIQYNWLILSEELMLNNSQL